MCNQDTCVYFHWPPSVVIGNTDICTYIQYKYVNVQNSSAFFSYKHKDTKSGMDKNMAFISAGVSRFLLLSEEMLRPITVITYDQQLQQFKVILYVTYIT